MRYLQVEASQATQQSINTARQNNEKFAREGYAVIKHKPPVQDINNN